MRNVPPSVEATSKPVAIRTLVVGVGRPPPLSLLTKKHGGSVEAARTSSPIHSALSAFASRREQNLMDVTGVRN